MKIHQLLLAILVLAIPFAQSCITESIGPQGPPGPQGPTGPQGEPGENGYIFEYENVNFTSPDYEVFLNHPDDFEGLDSDVTLVYFLWDIQTDDNGDSYDVWRQIPQTVFLENGTLIYDFDQTRFDVRLFLKSDFDLNTLTAIDTDGWIVRVVIVPANFWRTSIDYSDYYAVKEAFGLPELKKHEDILTRRQ